MAIMVSIGFRQAEATELAPSITNRKAIEKSPRYASAYAGIAEAYAIAGSLVLEVISPLEAMPKAQAAARKALEIDETLGEAHATMAYISAVYDYDWAAAEKGSSAP